MEDFVGQWYPRLYCLGLIEASAQQNQLLTARQYPRLYCLGLIEARFPGMSCRGPRPYPRLYCLGLIEATQQRVYFVERLTVSEALLPRPH